MPCILPLTLILIFDSPPLLTYLQHGSAAVAVAMATAVEALPMCIYTHSNQLKLETKPLDRILLPRLAIPDFCHEGL